MKVTVIDRAPVRVVYLRHTGPYGEPVSQFWQTTFFPWAAGNGLMGRPRYGICHDDPAVTDPALCRYDAGLEVPSNFLVTQFDNLPQGLSTRLPGGQYAVRPFKGTVAQLGDAWMAILHDWLPASGLQLDTRPSFEFYAKDAFYDPQSGVMGCDICIPVAPL